MALAFGGAARDFRVKPRRRTFWAQAIFGLHSDPTNELQNCLRCSTMAEAIKTKGLMP
jgi:hypothetical protein